MRRRAGLGLRGRLVTALVLTSAVTLAVAAVTLLSPIQRQLRNDEVHSLVEAAAGARAALARLSGDDLRPASRDLRRLVRTLRRRTAAQVTVVESHGRVLAATDADSGQRFPDGARAVRERRLVRGIVGAGDEQEARVAAPVTVDGERVGLILRRPLGEVRSAVGVVRRAFQTAALAGLGVALVLGLLLAAGLVRRLRALTATVTRVAEIGPSAELASDSSTDEVGTLTRSFARMQQRLHEQERARRTFVSTASHELRTPLASLRLMLDGLADDLGADEPNLDDAREQTARARTQAELLSKLSAELLDLSRIDAGLPLRSEPVELRELARSVAAEFTERSRSSRVAIAVTGAPRAWAVADPGSAAQIVRILLDNALGFAPQDTTVRVEIATRAGAATLAVADDGPGVPAGEREIVFERFRRGAQTGGHAGFGLGLAIGRELARRMEGDLTIAASASGARLELALRTAAQAAGSAS